MHNILFKNAEIISGILSIYILLGVFMPIMNSIITDETAIHFVLILGVTTFIITVLMFAMLAFVFEEYCYDQKTESENYRNHG